jgi:hypothetical protein
MGDVIRLRIDGIDMLVAFHGSGVVCRVSGLDMNVIWKDESDTWRILDHKSYTRGTRDRCVTIHEGRGAAEDTSVTMASKGGRLEEIWWAWRKARRHQYGSIATYYPWRTVVSRFSVRGACQPSKWGSQKWPPCTKHWFELPCTK